MMSKIDIVKVPLLCQVKASFQPFEFTRPPISRYRWYPLVLTGVQCVHKLQDGTETTLRTVRQPSHSEQEPRTEESIDVDPQGLACIHGLIPQEFPELLLCSRLSVRHWKVLLRQLIAELAFVTPLLEMPDGRRAVISYLIQDTKVR